MDKRVINKKKELSSIFDFVYFGVKGSNIGALLHPDNSQRTLQLSLPQQLPGTHFRLAREWQVLINVLPRDVSAFLRFEPSHLD